MAELIESQVPATAGPPPAAPGERHERRPAPPEPRRARLHLTDVVSRFGLLGAWAIVIAIFSLLRPDTFFTTANLQSIAGSQAVLLVVTLGLLIPLTAGEFDLSVAGTLTIANVLVGYLNVVHHWPIGLTVLAVLTAGVLIGAVNAFFVLVLEIESIVVTLGTGTLLLGAALGINNITIGGISDTLVSAARTQLLGIQLAFFYGLLLVVIVWYVFQYTPLGRYLFFVGSGRDVARLSGLRVQRIRAGSFIASGVIAAAAGVLLAGVLGASDPNAGGQYLLPAFAGAFLGATCIVPGRFNAWGSFVAVYFLVTGISGLQLLGLSGWIEQVFYGGSLVIAVSLSKLAEKRSAGRRVPHSPK
jgi:ribose transport system permease protein